MPRRESNRENSSDAGSRNSETCDDQDGFIISEVLKALSRKPSKSTRRHIENRQNERSKQTGGIKQSAPNVPGHQKVGKIPSGPNPSNDKATATSWNLLNANSCHASPCNSSSNPVRVPYVDGELDSDGMTRGETTRKSLGSSGIRQQPDPSTSLFQLTRKSVRYEMLDHVAKDIAAKSRRERLEKLSKQSPLKSALRTNKASSGNDPGQVKKARFADVVQSEKVMSSDRSEFEGDSSIVSANSGAFCSNICFVGGFLTGHSTHSNASLTDGDTDSAMTGMSDGDDTSMSYTLSADASYMSEASSISRLLRDDDSVSSMEVLANHLRCWDPNISGDASSAYSYGPRMISDEESGFSSLPDRDCPTSDSSKAFSADLSHISESSSFARYMRDDMSVSSLEVLANHLQCLDQEFPTATRRACKSTARGMSDSIPMAPETRAQVQASMNSNNSDKSVAARYLRDDVSIGTLEMFANHLLCTDRDQISRGDWLI